MRPQVMKEAIRLAKSDSGPFCMIAARCLKENQLDPVKLEVAIEQAGYTIRHEEATHGDWIRVVDPAGVLKAQGYSSAGREDAMLHAVYGAVREEEAAKVVDTLLVDRNIQVAPDLRQQLASRYITQGGRSRLEKDLAHLEALR